MRQKVFTLPAYAAGVGDSIVSAQPANEDGVNELSLNGSAVVNGVAVLDVQRQVSVTTEFDASAVRIVIIGTDNKGNEVLESIRGPAGAPAQPVSSRTVKPFKTVTRVLVEARTGVDTYDVGTSDFCATNWIVFDYHQSKVNISTQCILSEAPGAVVSVVGTIDNVVDYRGNDTDPNVGTQVGSIFDREFPDFTSFVLSGISEDLTDLGEAPITAIRMESSVPIVGGDVSMKWLQSHHGPNS